MKCFLLPAKLHMSQNCAQVTHNPAMLQAMTWLLPWAECRLLAEVTVHGSNPHVGSTGECCLGQIFHLPGCPCLFQTGNRTSTSNTV